MTPADPRILALNAGSSSIRFASYRAGATLERELHGSIDRIGGDATLAFEDAVAGRFDRGSVHLPNHASAGRFLVSWLDARRPHDPPRAVGHRVVHGMDRTSPARVTPELLDELRTIVPFDPDHLPVELELIEAFGERYPGIPQLACFDTAFHRTMPRVATQLAIPRRYTAAGLRRYGFHGLSCEWLVEELARRGDPAATDGRVILAHLGSGASMTAVLHGRSIDTSMGFTPSGGLMMGTRPGDLDPGVTSYLARREHLSAAQIDDMVHHESGLLGVSETSGDMRDLLAREIADVRAAEAVELFTYQARKWIGLLAAVLGGLDTLVFAGGIGENAPVVRERICAGLGFLGLSLDPERNAAGAPVISSPMARVAVRVLHTDEALVIARSVARVLQAELERGVPA